MIFLIIDYLQQFKVKPKRWYASTLSPQQRKEVIRVLSKHYHLDKELLFRYASGRRSTKSISCGYL